jgi:hypothetical protein
LDIDGLYAGLVFIVECILPDLHNNMVLILEEYKELIQAGAS